LVGIIPRRIPFPDQGTAVWVPIGIDPAKTNTAAFD
jgi:hypothetical protein